VKQFFRHWNEFTSLERNGILVLLVLIFFTLMIPWVYRALFQVRQEDFGPFNREMDEFLEGLAKDSMVGQGTSAALTELPTAGHQPVLFPFDPNTLPDSGWLHLGISERQIRTIRNFQSKGGRFRKKEDLAKIYGLSAKEYQRIEPFITIPSVHHEKPPEAISQKQTRPVISIDLNQADTTKLMELKGIGPSFAKRIIKYRERLGGFYSVDQLLEVYGFDQARLDGIRGYCNTGTGPYRKIPLNLVSTQELMKHPYMDYTTAKAIVDFRISRKVISEMGQLGEVPSIPAELLEKMRHYFTLDH